MKGGSTMMLILDDHPLARQGLSSVIQMCRTEEKIVEAGTVDEAVTLMGHEPIDMAFVDLKLGRESGFTFIEWMKEGNKDVKAFIITSSSLPSDFDKARELGVDAYVLKDAFLDEIVCGIRVVERGGKFYSAALMDNHEQHSDMDKAIGTLTAREKEVFTLLGKGCGNVKISQTLFIAEGTVKKHIASILGKLQLESRMAAALMASKSEGGAQGWN